MYYSWYGWIPRFNLWVIFFNLFRYTEYEWKCSVSFVLQVSLKNVFTLYFMSFSCLLVTAFRIVNRAFCMVYLIFFFQYGIHVSINVLQAMFDIIRWNPSTGCIVQVSHGGWLQGPSFCYRKSDIPGKHGVYLPFFIKATFGWFLGL